MNGKVGGVFVGIQNQTTVENIQEFLQGCDAPKISPMATMTKILESAFIVIRFVNDSGSNC